MVAGFQGGDLVVAGLVSVVELNQLVSFGGGS